MFTWERAKIEEAYKKAIKYYQEHKSLSPEIKAELDKATLKNINFGDRVERMLGAKNSIELSELYESAKSAIASQIHENDRRLGRYQAAAGQIAQGGIVFAIADLLLDICSYGRGVDSPSNELDLLNRDLKEKKTFDLKNEQ